MEKHLEKYWLKNEIKIELTGPAGSETSQPVLGNVCLDLATKEKTLTKSKKKTMGMLIGFYEECDQKLWGF